MDAVSLNVLKAEIEAQLEKIDQVYRELDDRASQMQPDVPGLVESTAYQLHNLYNAIEDLFKIVANAFENSVTDRSRWHTELLRRMTLNIQGVRPALLTSETVELLDELRAFRHFFRHAYGVRLRSGRVEEDVAIARQLQPLLKCDVKQFLEQLGIDDAN
jgi:hypothetical protein